MIFIIEIDIDQNEEASCELGIYILNAKYKTSTS